MEALTFEKTKPNFDNLDQFGVSEINKKEISKINGGSVAAMVGGAFVIGVAVGVGVYYGVKALTN